MAPPIHWQHLRMFHLTIILALGFGGILSVARGSWASASGTLRISPAHGSSGESTTDGGEHFIEIPIDHFENKTSETFKNRFWVNVTYWKKGGPVFVFDSGEQDAAPLVPYYLQEYHGQSAVMRLAEKYKGVAILWEHRFYGASLPFPVNRNTTGDQWQFLNTEQALEDFIFFANSFQKSSPARQAPSLREVSPDGQVPSLHKILPRDLPDGQVLSLHEIENDPLVLPVHPSGTPWIFLGGSYPGIRAAFLRIRNPEVVFASWASSAPVQAEVDMASYYKAAERSLTRNCSTDWVSVTRHVDDTLMGEDDNAKTQMKLDLLRARAGKPGGNTTEADGISEDDARNTSALSAASILMDPLDFYQYYGFTDSLLPFCHLLETKNFTQNATEKGISAVEGTQSAFKAFLTAISELDYDSIPSSPDDPVADRSWMWQYCSEYGFYQRGDRNNPLSIETAFLSLDLFQHQCNQTFKDTLPPSPQTSKVNKYGGWNMNPSNVLFTNGEFDPWRTMGLASIEDNAPKRTPSLDIPECNTAFSDNNTFFGMTYENMVHVSDMRVLLTPDSNHTNFRTVGFYSPISQEPFFRGLNLFQLALDKWLPCFDKQLTH